MNPYPTATTDGRDDPAPVGVLFPRDEAEPGRDGRNPDRVRQWKRVLALRAADRRALAERFGLPPDLQPAEVAAAVALAAGPITAVAVRTAMAAAGRRPRADVFQQLVKRGLVVRVRAGKRVTFLLSGEAMDRMAAAGAKGGAS